MMPGSRRSPTGPHAVRSLLLATGCLLVASWLVVPGRADAGAPPTDEARELAERFAPIVVVKAQDGECDADGERFVPMPADIVLDNDQVALRQVGNGDPVVTWAPSAADIAGLGEGFFLDFPGSALDPGCIYERDFDRYTDGVEPTVYAHVVDASAEHGAIFLQFWLYWYFNDWNNKHESDWEGIALEFEASSVAEALASEPVAVGYSQHSGGERADWNSDKLQREGDHPLVFSSVGSHASYFGAEVYLGRAADEGFGCDSTTGPSEAVRPAVVVLPDTVDDPDDPLAWLSFRGRWGERQQGAFNGPTGPSGKDRWTDPAPWFAELRSDSVVIPAGDSALAGVIGVFCGAVGAGSDLMISFTSSPTRLLLALVIVTLLARFVIGRTDWARVPAAPVVRRRRGGQILRATVDVYRRSPAAFASFGLVYVPAAILAGALVELVQRIPVLSSLVTLVGRGGGTGVVVAALVGSVANLAAFVVVNALTAAYLAGDDRGPDAAVDAVRRTWARARTLLGAFVRAFAVVFVLLLSVIGIPWAVRALVQYQFAPQAVMIDGAGGTSALRRSRALVEGRWWHTALFVVVLNGIVAATALLLGLLLLVLVTGTPLWLLSGLVSIVSGLLVPFAAVAMTLLYGDAVAEHGSPPELPNEARATAAV